MNARVRVFDNAGATVDRYTVLISRTEKGAKVWDLYTMSENPKHPQGVNMYSFTIHDDEKRARFLDESTRVRVQDLGEEVRTAIEERI
jgi:hypothetical protein